MSISELHKLFLQSTGVSTDSRNLWDGCIYLSLKGEHFNGNDFATQALKEGAAYSVIDEKDFVTLDERLIKVENGLETLQKLASYHRTFCGWPTLGITGSNGKTTSSL